MNQVNQPVVDDKGKSPEASPDIAKLTEQIENLNKAVAVARSEAKTAAEQAIETYKAELESKSKDLDRKKKTEDIELTASEQKKFDAYAAKNNLLTKEDLEAERQRIASESVRNVATQAVNEFLEKHPEYDTDEKWAKIQAEFNLYKTPGDLAGYKKLLNKIHVDLSGGTKDRARAEARAEIIKKTALTRGGQGAGAASSTGDYEAEVDKMQTKYPSLSRDQIEARLAEIHSMYPKNNK